MRIKDRKRRDLNLSELRKRKSNNKPYAMMMKRAIIIAIVVIVAVAFFFLAPIIPMQIPRSVVYAYNGSCSGGPHSFDPVQTYVSISYRLIPAPNHVVVAGNWGLVYLPNGIPAMSDRSTAFFPPILVNSYVHSICA